MVARDYDLLYFLRHAYCKCAPHFRGLRRPFWCSIVLSGAALWCHLGGGLGGGVGGVWAADAACWLGDDG